MYACMYVQGKLYMNKNRCSTFVQSFYCVLQNFASCTFPFFQVLRKSDGSLNLFQKHSFSSKISKNQRKNILSRDSDGGMQMSEDLHINQNTCAQVLHIRIFAYYQAYHVTNQLKISFTNLMLEHLSKSWILNTALWLIGQHQIVLEDESNLRGRP